ncbi:hypothetical protein A3C59_05070 [Candidatus Daviesbacteria bacterium RIFCSPHIGHO2_02_FULL_36_13]|uniref:Uncharacterized protein n=1 Tax=Candidatus Daviesbacteria bacterium RIFCSPHIGHO2_02_FULL_36_13 TaxID=1797768 RepID=A0A1F5JXS9_9BACT|nr:MAG: hypothetical protein A3C59_05070 [Candidatus Daviesbacteria bacterium RIFCSPHIGHO2_02_FULL_36_13]
MSLVEAKLFPLETHLYDTKGNLIGNDLVDVAENPYTEVLAIAGIARVGKSLFIDQLGQRIRREIVLAEWEEALEHGDRIYGYNRNEWSPPTSERISRYYQRIIQRKLRETKGDPSKLVVAEAPMLRGADNLDRGGFALEWLGKNPHARVIGIVPDEENIESANLTRQKVVEALDHQVFEVLQSSEPPIRTLGVEYTPENGRKIKRSYQKQATPDRADLMARQIRVEDLLWAKGREIAIESIVVPDPIKNREESSSSLHEDLLDPTKENKIQSLKISAAHMLEYFAELGFYAERSIVVISAHDSEREILWDPRIWIESLAA